MKSAADALFKDGWDRAVYDNPGYFLYILRRHTWTGAFSHPKYGGNPGGLGWAFLSATFRTTATPLTTAHFASESTARPSRNSEQTTGTSFLPQIEHWRAVTGCHFSCS